MTTETRDGWEGLSDDARSCLARWFAGSRHELTSHEPHVTLNKVRSAMDELVARGLITREPYNDHGSIRFRSTPEAARIGFEQLKRAWVEMELVRDPIVAAGATPDAGGDRG